MGSELLGTLPWILCANIYTLLESLSIRDSFDIGLKRKKIKKCYFTLVIVLLFLWMIIAARFAPSQPVKTIAIFLFLFLEAHILYEGKPWRKLLVTVCVAAMCLLFDVVNLQIMSRLMKEEIVVIMNDEVALYYMALTSKLVQMLLIKMLKCVVGENKIKSMYKFDRLLCIVVPVAIMLNAYTNFMSNLQNREITKWDIFGVLFLIVLGSMVYLVMYRMGEYYEEKSQVEVLDNRMKSGIAYMESLQQTHKKIRQLAHGFENQMSIVHSLLNNEEYEKAKEYLSEITNTVEQNILPVHTNNIVIDAVLNEMFIMAVSKKIKMNFNIQDLGTIPMTVSDMASILHNGIHNAIEACERIPEEGSRMIELQISNEEKELIISIQNTTLEKERVIVNNSVESKKENKEEHGLGLESIKTVIEKYNGKLFLEWKNYNFHLMAVIG